MDSDRKNTKITEDKNKRSRSLQASDKPKPRDNRSKDKSSVYKIASTASLPSNIQVYVRVRPLINLETAKTTGKCVELLSKTKLICDEEREFNYDIVFGEDSSQDQIFTQSIKPNLDKALVGYNCCIFAYGQTGAGKTHTMGSNLSKDSNRDKDIGMIPRSLNYIFNVIKKCDDYEFTAKMSLIEIYNEEIIDLLNYKAKSKSFTLREDKSGEVFITGLTENDINNSEDAIKYNVDKISLIIIGTQNRKVAPTYSNEVSSRSHAIFTVFFEKINKITKEKVNFKINFVDLAGSERIKKSGVTGDRFKESVSINSGLLALSKVIMALADSDRKGNNVHIPYRESKLTRILKDSLGGNSLTIMLACISPSEINLEETVNTLNYASFARTIKIKPSQNLEVNDTDSKALIDSLMKEIEQLKNEIKILKEKETKETNLEELNKMLDKKIGEVINEEQSESDEEVEDVKEKIDKKLYEEVKCENNILKNIVKALRERETNLLEKLNNQPSENVVSISVVRETNPIKLGEDENEEENTEDIQKLKNEYCNHEKNVIDEKVLKDLDEENDISDIKVTDSSFVVNQKDDEIKKLKSILREELKKKQEKQKIESNVIIIKEKIKKLKDFQNTLKEKLIENESFKNKLNKLKNEEIELIKIDILDKNKSIRNLEQENLRNSQLLDMKNTTISNLKNKLRTKSVEVSENNTRNNNRGYEVLQTMESVNNISAIKKKNNIPLVNKEELFEENNNNNTKFIKRSSNVDVDQAYILNIKSLIKQIEEEILKKHKLEKKLKIVFKEKTNFSNLIVKMEEKYQLKISENNQQKEQYEQQLKLLDLEEGNESSKEKSQITQKIKILTIKLENVNQRIDKINGIKLTTLNELINSENLINNQICQCDIKINDIKYQIENNNCNKSRPIFTNPNNKSRSNYNSPKNTQGFKLENNEDSEGEEVSIGKIDFDNFNQEKLNELDKLYKEKIEFLENKLKKISVKIESSSNNENNQVPQINNNIIHNNYVGNINPVIQEYESPTSSPRKTNFESNIKVVNLTRVTGKKNTDGKEEKKSSSKLPPSKLPPKVVKQNITAKVDTGLKGRSSSITNKSYGSNSKNKQLEN